MISEQQHLDNDLCGCLLAVRILQCLISAVRLQALVHCCLYLFLLELLLVFQISYFFPIICLKVYMCLFSWTKQITWNDAHCFHMPLLGKSVQPTMMVVALSKSGWIAMLALKAKLSMNGMWKWFRVISFAGILLCVGWILNNCQFNTPSSQVTHYCHLLGSFHMASWNHSLGVLWYHLWTQPVLFPYYCWTFIPRWTQFCMQVLFLNKFRMTDEYLTI